ncbi:MAG: bile acid:sodium symporter family protein [Anaerolineales bacterium]|nr:bile acid:sodium symporter family protein [Anaerolineales bacterium]
MINRFAEFIRKNYQTIIISTVIIGLLLGLWTTTPGKVLQGYSKILTFLMILFISLTITPRQFAMVLRQPWAVLAGLVLNFLFMPLVCWALARTLVSDPQLATGIILVGVVPCAGMAAVWTALLKGDVPLGMAINGLTMVLAPFLIPPLMLWLAGSGVKIDPWAMFRQLALILLIPLALGILLRWLADRFWSFEPYQPLLPALSALTAVLLMFAVCNVNVPLITARWSLVPALLGAVILIFPIGFLIPHWLGKFALDWPQRIAVTYSSGMKNLPIAVGLAFSSFSEQPLVGLPVALAFILQMLTASTFYRYLNRQSESVNLEGQAGL